MNESEKSEGYLAIIIKANGIFQNKVIKKRTWKIPYLKRRKGREATYLYRICHLYGIMDRKKEKEYNDESNYNTVGFHKNF